MKKINGFMMAAVCGGMCLGSCSQEVFNEAEPELTGQQHLRVITRSDVPVSEGRVYIMNATGTCTKQLETDASGAYNSGNLSTGSYEIYALGSDDLSKFTLPSQTEASAKSVIKASGEAMADLLMAHQSIELQDGQDVIANIVLERKMIMIEGITISNVPSNTTGVSVRQEPLYQSIKLNGDFDTEDNGTAYSIALNKGEGNTWAGEPRAMLFPSKGKPTITISLESSEGIKSYSFSPSEPLEANHKVKISGNYQNAHVLELTGTLSAQAWGENKNINFDFGEENKVEIPVAGQTYLGYYVVSSPTGSAVLLRKAQVQGIDSEAKLAEALAAITKRPEGVSCGEWRLPTSEECRTFIADDYVNGLYFNAWYYCMEGNTLKKMFNKQNSDGSVTITGPLETDFDNEIYFRAVIDITY